MGNPDFAVPSLQSISESSHKIIAVVSNRPKRIGRGNKIKETGIGIAAKAMKIPLLQPPKLNDKQFLQYLSRMMPDIFVVVAYKILSDRLLAIPNMVQLTYILHYYQNIVVLHQFNGHSLTATHKQP